MSKKIMNIKPIAAAVGVAFATSMAMSTTALASENPFEAADLESGFMLAGGDKDKDKDEDKEGECGEGKCGEGICGEDDDGDSGEDDDGDDDG